MESNEDWYSVSVMGLFKEALDRKMDMNRVLASNCTVMTILLSGFTEDEASLIATKLVRASRTAGKFMESSHSPDDVQDLTEEMKKALKP